MFLWLSPSPGSSAASDTRASTGSARGEAEGCIPTRRATRCELVEGGGEERETLRRVKAFPALRQAQRVGDRSIALRRTWRTRVTVPRCVGGLSAGVRAPARSVGSPGYPLGNRSRGRIARDYYPRFDKLSAWVTVRLRFEKLSAWVTVRLRFERLGLWVTLRQRCDKLSAWSHCSTVLRPDWLAHA